MALKKKINILNEKIDHLTCQIKALSELRERVEFTIDQMVRHVIPKPARIASTGLRG